MNLLVPRPSFFNDVQVTREDTHGNTSRSELGPRKRSLSVGGVSVTVRTTFPRKRLSIRKLSISRQLRHSQFADVGQGEGG